MKALAIVALLVVIGLMAWTSLRMNRLKDLVDRLEEGWKPMHETDKENES